MRAVKYIKRVLNYYGRGKHKYVYRGIAKAKARISPAAKKVIDASGVPLCRK